MSDPVIEAVVHAGADGTLTGPTSVSTRTLGELGGMFRDEAARAELPADTVVYRVEAYLPVDADTPGGLFFGTSFLEPGTVGDECFMTRGHVHARPEAAEFYWGIEGDGRLVLMDEDRSCRAEIVRPGSVHYVPGRVAHRLANVGDTTLAVGACWPADAGHDYTPIDEHGFSARVRLVDGEPRLVPVDDD